MSPRIDRFMAPAAAPGLAEDFAFSPPAKVKTLTALFEAQAARVPRADAIICGDTAVTYAELEASANQLACALLARGVGPGSFVALLMRRSVDVYVALLAVQKTGAAYVPLDPDYPPDRVQFILQDCAVQCAITVRALASKNSLPASLAFCLDEEREYLAALPAVRPITAEVQANAVAYVIYTSGSTGKPKGVLISQHSAVHLVQAEAEMFRVGTHDRVFQGFSIGFDASVEEIWLAFRAGATLIVGTDEVMQLGPSLCNYLSNMRVTVWSTVPTLLAMQENAVSSLRLLILGGEACSQTLVDRWWRKDLRFVNTYGPTEATVIATYADCYPGQPVSIGQPVPGYRALIVDGDMRPVAAGDGGELLLGGPGLALGYVGQPELTAAKFIELTITTGFSERLYRTGDLVRCGVGGQLEFLGRIDDQVKLRGFRIELGEIESVLLACPAVRAAAVAVQVDPYGVQALVAYLVTAAGYEERRCRDELKQRLPKYMTPRLFQLLDQLPVLPSGKTDRKRLPLPDWLTADKEPPPKVSAVTAMEAKILGVWQQLLHPQQVGLNDDFFELGGHSLLATKLISELRRDPELRHAAVLDLYRHPTVKSLCKALTQSAAPKIADRDSDVASAKSSWYQTAGGALTQAAGFYLMYALLTLSWVSVYFGLAAIKSSPSVVSGLGRAGLAFVLVLLAQLLLPVVVKWSVIGRFKAGSYPVRSGYYWRFWLVRAVLTYFGPSYLSGTPWLSLYYRLLGARIGRDVELHTDDIVVTDLLSIGDRASINADVRLLGFTLNKGALHIGPITIGADAYIGARSVVQPGATIGAKAQLGELSLLPSGARLPADAVWSGSPAKPSGVRLPDLRLPPALLTRSTGGRVVLAGLYAVLAVLAMMVPVAAFVPVFQGVAAVEREWGWLLGAAVTPPLMALGVVLMCLLVAALKWVVVGRVRPGSYPVHGSFYCRKWFVDLQLGLSLNLLSPLYATVYLPHWLRLLGARIGKNSEISTAANITPDLLHIGADCFVADDVCLGAGRLHGGVLTLGRVELGQGSFTGNSAVVSGGQDLAPGSLVGCLTAANPRAASLVGASWLGSPAMLIPRREAPHAFNAVHTHKPKLGMRLLRLAIEFGRITMPGTLLITVSRLFSRQVEVALLTPDVGNLLLLPLQLMAWGTLAVGLVIAAKWLLVGTYRAGVKPLWSTFVWRSELVNALHEQIGEFFLTAFGLGTPLMNLYLRLMGTKVGRGAVVDSANITEFDLVGIGEHALVGWSCDLQTHLFEDRIMKMDAVTLGDHCSVGEATLVLYDSVVEPRSTVGGLSLVMKGETIPGGASWLGIPVRPDVLLNLSPSLIGQRHAPVSTAAASGAH